jgi:L-asparagine oxygenase
MYMYKGVPTGPVPRTPTTNDCNVGATTELCKNQEAIVKKFAPLVAYKEECNGAMFQDIVPVKSLAKLQTSTSSDHPLEIHTEQAFWDKRPTFISLACLRGDPTAVTYVLSMETLLKHLSDEDVEYLKKPMWMCRVDTSFILGGAKNVLYGPMPILNGSSITFDQDLMSGVVPKADLMIQKIVDIYEKHRTSIVLEAGDVLVLDNRVYLHGRSKFTPRYDGTDRFLIRCFARN